MADAERRPGALKRLARVVFSAMSRRRASAASETSARLAPEAPRPASPALERSRARLQERRRTQTARPPQIRKDADRDLSQPSPAPSAPNTCGGELKSLGTPILSPAPIAGRRDAAAPLQQRAPKPDNPFVAALLASAERVWRGDAPGAGAGGPAVREPLSSRRPRQRGAAPVSVEARVEGVRLHAMDREGEDPSTAIILIHGAGLDHRDWTFSFLEGLPRAYRVLAFDRPGFGDSSRPSIAGGLPTTQARLLRTAAMSLGVERAVLVGHSWGGAVAMAWGLDAPEATIGVVSLAGAVAPWSLGSSIAHGRRMRSAARMALRPGGLRTAAIEGLTESFSPNAIPNGYLEHIATELTLTSGAAAAAAGDVATFNGALGLQAQRYPGFDRPVELVYGDADLILSPSEQGEAASELLPNARLTIEKGAGHMIHHTHPDLCLEAILRAAAEEDTPETALEGAPASSLGQANHSGARL